MTTTRAATLGKFSTRQKFVVGNWKMYTNTLEASQLAGAIVAGMGIEDAVTVIVCPPFPYLALVGEILKNSCVLLGAQNLYPQNEGAFTGEVSPVMIRDLGCKYVILGHSERRHKLGELDAFINQKVLIALSEGLNVILCVGETLDQRKDNQTQKVLEGQITEGLIGVSPETLTNLSVAYEPVWAIGNQANHATAEQAQDAHAIIRHKFGQLFGEQAAQALIIQYGGSINPQNAAAFFSKQGVDGVLIGGDSLKADQFLAIVKAGINSSKIK